MKSSIDTKTDNGAVAPQPANQDSATQCQTPHAYFDKGLYPNEVGYAPKSPVAVGGVILSEGDINYNCNRRTLRIEVVNTGDRPIQVGSHFHFFEVNRYLEFDRKAAFGCHLNIPATTAIRFEPGDKREVELVSYAGKQRIVGFNNLVMGYSGCEDAPTHYPTQMHSFRKMRHLGFKSTCSDSACTANSAEPSNKCDNKSTNAKS